MNETIFGALIGASATLIIGVIQNNKSLYDLITIHFDFVIRNNINIKGRNDEKYI